MFLETGQRIIRSATRVIVARVNSLAGVVHLLVILQMIFSAKCSIAYITCECFSLRVYQQVSLEFEFGCETLHTT